MRPFLAVNELPHPLVREIGRSVPLFAHIEVLVLRAIEETTGLDATSNRILVAGVQFSTKLDLLDVLIRAATASGEIRNCYDECETLCRTSSDFRNRLMHGQYAREAGDGPIHLLWTKGSWTVGEDKKIPRRIKPEATPLTVEIIRDHNAVQRRTIVRLRKLCELLEGRRQALPQKPQSPSQ